MSRQVEKTSGGCAVNSWQTTTIYFRVAVYFAFLGRDKGQYKLYLEDRCLFVFLVRFISVTS